MWDDEYQRWYYVEEATGRSQWEAPGFERSSLASGGEQETRGYGDSSYSAPPQQYGGGGYGGYGGGHSGGGAPDYGYGGQPQQQYGGYQQPPPPQSYGGYDQHQQQAYGGEPVKEKKKDNSGLYMGAAAGLAVGAIGGAVIAHELGKFSSPHLPAATPCYDVMVTNF